MSESLGGPPKEAEKDAPTHFVIKVRHNGQDAYALCASVLLVDHANLVGIAATDLDRFIAENPLPAAALLSGAHTSDGMSGKLLAGMSGRMAEGMGGKSVNVSIDGNGNVINVSDPKKSGD